MSKRSNNVVLRKTYFATLALLCALGVFGKRALAQGSGKAGDIRVVLKPSDVARQKGPQVVKTDAEKGMTLIYNDVLETGVGGRMRARLDDGSILALGSQTNLKVIEHNRQTEQTTFQLEAGKVRAQVVKQTQPNAHFDIKTNTAVAGVLGTDEVVDAFSPIATLVMCLDGRVGVRNVDPAVPGNVILLPGQVTIVQQGQAPSAPRAATPEELASALDITGGPSPDAIADVGTGFATVGQELLLSAADSFSGTGTISSYKWQISRARDNLGVYDNTLTNPTVQVDTTNLTPGNYKGVLTVANSDNRTGTASFGFVVLPADIATSNPQQVIQQLKYAYETLQPSEFMKLFDPVKYTGYAALRDSIENSFRNIAQMRVFVRTASGQIYPEIKAAVYQVDFEIQYSTKVNPTQNFVTHEQATLRMESGSDWLITDVPQGSLGAPGLVGIPGTNNPRDVNQSGTQQGVGGGSNIHISVGGETPIKIISGGTSPTFTIQNRSNGTITVTINLPPGITISGTGVKGNTVTIPAGGTVEVTITVGPGVPPGTIPIDSTVTSGGSSQPGPEVSVTIFKLTLNVLGAGSSAANPATVFLGIGGQATVQAFSQTGAGQSVSLSASGGQVATSFSNNPVVLTEGGASSTITMTPVANATPGADQVTIQGIVGGVPTTTTLFINRIAPFSFTRTSSAAVNLTTGGSAPVSFNVNFNAPFAGPVVVTAPPAAGGVSFSPPSATVNSSGTVNFTVTGTAVTPTPLSFSFTATTGGFSQSDSVIVNVGQPIQFTLGGGSSSIQPGQTSQVNVPVGFVSGVPQPVIVAVLPGSVNTSLITVTGGGTVPNASGSAPVSISIAPNAPPGVTSFTVTGTAGGTVQQATINVTILGDFSFSGPPSVSVLQSTSVTASIRVISIDGFNAPIILTASSNNPSVTVSAPPSASVSSPLVLNIAASATASGPAAITITGTSGTANHSFTIAVSVGAFTLSTTAAQPIPLFLGGTASLPVTVTAVSGFTNDVALTATATGGVTVSSVAPVPGGNGSVTFVLGTSASAVVGTASVIITGTSGPLSTTLQVAVQVTQPFTLTSSAPQPLQMFIGMNANLPVSVVAAPGFTADVNLIASPSPGLTTNSVLPVSGGSGSRTFILGTSIDAVAGTVALTITGTSGNFSTTLKLSVQLIDGFTMTADPAQLFLGNPSPVVLHIKRAPNFTGGVVAQVGTLPAGVVSVDHPSIIAPNGTDTITFQVTADIDPALSGKNVVIPISATATASAVAAGDGRRAASDIARVVSVGANAVLQAPFLLIGGGNLGTIPSGTTSGGSVTVSYLGNPVFVGTVQVVPQPVNGLAFSGGGTLTGSGTVPFSVTSGAASAIFTFQVLAKAGAFTLSASFSITVTAPPPPPPPPPPPAGPIVTVSPVAPLQVNGNIPVAILVQVIPPSPNFSSVVTVSVPDGTQMQYDPICGAPAGFVSYSGVAGVPSSIHALTFTVGPPYTGVRFCMSAGQASAGISAGPDSINITGSVSSAVVSATPYSFQIGVPVLPAPTPVAGSTFDIPVGGVGTASVNVQFTGGFNPSGGVTVFLAGIGSTVSTGKPSVALPSGITSTDCGPTTSGKVLTTTGTVTCNITNVSAPVSTTPISLEAFVAFPNSPASGSAVATQFQICSLASTAPAGTQSCGPGIVRIGDPLLRISDGRTTDGQPLRFGEVRAGSGLPVLSIAPSAIQFSPLLPKEGDRVTFRARVENRGEADAHGVRVVLLVNKQTVAMQDLDIAANSSAVAEFEWHATYQPRLSVSVAVDPDGEIAQEGNLLRVAALRNFSVEPALPALARQGRSLVVVTNGDCGGFRFANGFQSFCGGSSDVELNPTISASGQLVVQASSLNGGIVDLGPVPTNGVLDAPQGSYPSRALLQGGHLYVVESNGKFALMYIGRMESDIDPRLARLESGTQVSSGSIPVLGSDPLGNMLDRAKITVEMQWSYLDNGSRRFQYGFSASRSIQSGATVYRQPRTPAAPAKQ